VARVAVAAREPAGWKSAVAVLYNYQQDVPIWNNTGCSEIAVFFFACSIDFVLKRNIL
jgi:hypothetical protein